MVNGKSKHYDAVIDLPFGRVAIRTVDGGLARLSPVSTATALKAPTTGLAQRVCDELTAYLRDPCHQFKLPLAVRGTPFQQKVWRSLTSVEPGAPVTYGAIASRLKTSPRAVGGACRRNPVPIIVPCHRVVSVTGDGGYMGQTDGAAIRLKRWLLQHEARQ
jgi:methylated-DNA-[protein]-cysteine S-methyltransferase